MRRLAIFVTFATLVAGCDGRTVSWYIAHSEAREAKVASCMNDPGAGRVDPGCANALEAHRLLMLRPGGGSPSIL